MRKTEGNNSLQFENELKQKFIRIKPDENFVEKLSDRLFEHSSITMENSKKYLYHLFFILFGIFSGYFLYRIIKKVFQSTSHKEKDINSKISQS